jgi:CheY-like chemotaxis protein
VVRSAVETSRPHVESLHHRFTLSMPPEPLWVEADPVRLAQVFANLLNNAAKYTDAGGRIWLTARIDGGSVLVTVRDTGVGIPAELLPRVFDMFTQDDGHDSHRVQGGLGVGLTLARTLVEMHGGSITAESSGPGQGSEFTVRLPLTEPPSLPLAAPSEAAVSSAGAERRRVLVVDDNRDAADSLGLLLRLLGVEVHVAHDGPSALQAVPLFQPSLIFLDLGMPGMDGYEVARRLRRQPGLDDIVLVALTGWGQEEDRRRSRAAGFDHHLIKPAEIGELKALLASVQVAT